MPYKGDIKEMNYIFRGKQSCGLIIYENPIAFSKALATFKGTFEVVLRKIRTPKTNQQTKYIWVLYQIVGDELGYTKEEVHEAFKNKFLIEDPNAKLPRTRSLRDLSLQEANIYIEQIISFCALFLGITLPNVGEVE